jgi:hypothetical protein
MLWPFCLKGESAEPNVEEGGWILEPADLLVTDLNRKSSGSISIVRFEAFTAVTMKNGVFWGVRPCGSYKNRSVRRLLVTANVIPI